MHLQPLSRMMSGLLARVYGCKRLPAVPKGCAGEESSMKQACLDSEVTQIKW